MAMVPAGPGSGLTPGRAQGWVLVAAIITGVVYAFRKVIEPATPSSSKTTGVKSLLGSGPAPPIEQWVVSYGTAFLILSVIAFASPETAGSLSILIVIGTLLANGQSVVKDINALEGK